MDGSWEETSRVTWLSWGWCLGKGDTAQREWAARGTGLALVAILAASRTGGDGRGQGAGTAGGSCAVPAAPGEDGWIAELWIDDCCQLVACLTSQGTEADSMPSLFKGFLPQDMIYC